MEFNIIRDICCLNEADWDGLSAKPYPFASFAFLSALEKSGAISERTGWLAHHLCVFDQGKLIAAMPSYLKLHSYGEYVFDFQWAEAYQRNGLDYYPKLVSAIPFSPVSGPRLLLHADYCQEKTFAFLQQKTKECLQNALYSSWHILFPVQAQASCFTNYDLGLRRAVHFKWQNNHYTSFDHFLEHCNSRHRKNIRKERRKVSDMGITLKQQEGEEVSDKDWQLFYQFYQATYLKRSGHGGYLSADFFILLRQNLAKHLMLVTASKEDEMIGAALYLKDENTLYGRYWGSYTEDDCLHFEACYYQGIDYCIQHRLQYFDPGVQGEHKLQRGFAPHFTLSNHWLAHSEFHAAVQHFLAEEAPHVEQYFAYTETRLPFKKV
ncbi:MAG: GNAT family N-acetyltransferase [Oleiphilus sp.]